MNDLKVRDKITCIKGPARLLTACLALVLALSGCAAISKMVSPEAYVKGAWEKTGKAMETDAPSLAGFNRFMDGPYEQRLSVGLKDANLGQAAEAKGASAAVTAKTDNAAKKMLMNVDISLGGIKFENNEIYISQDIVALAAPILYSDHRYITVAPATFTADWNGSDLGANMPLPEDFDLPAYIDAMFETNSVTAEVDADAYAAQVKEMNKKLIEGTAFSSGGSETLDIGGSQTKVDKYTYAVPATALKEYYTSFLDMYLSLMDEYAAGYGNTGEGLPPEYEAMKSTLESVAFTGDMTMDVYVDGSQHIRKIALSGVSFTAEGLPEGGALAADITYTGEGNPYSASVANLALTSGESTYSAVVNTTSASSKTLLDERADIEFTNADGQRVNVGLSLKWDTALAEGDNLSAGCILKGDMIDSEITLTGALRDTAEEIALTNGVLRIDNYPTEEFVEISCELGLKGAAAEDLAVDVSDARSLFDFDIMELYGMMMRLG